MSHKHGYRPFYKDFIRFMLTRKFYAKVLTYTHRHKGPDQIERAVHTEENEGEHPAIIPLTLFDSVQIIRNGIGKNSRRAGAKHRIFPLSQVLQCGLCQGSMRGNTGKNGVRYYQCSSRGERHPMPDGSYCKQPMVQAENIEKQFVGILSRLTIPTDLWPDILTHVYYQDDAEVIDYKRSQLRAEIDRYSVLFDMGVVSQEKLEKGVRSVREKIRALTPSAQSSAPEAEALLRDLPALWQAANPPQQKALADCMFRLVTLSGKQITAYQLRPFLKEQPA